MKKVVIISGGGVKGIIPATAIAGFANHTVPDLYVGTSIGAILVAGLALGIPRERLQADFKSIISKVFGKKSLFPPKYSLSAATAILHEYFESQTGKGNASIKNLRTPVMVSAAESCRDITLFLKSDNEDPNRSVAEWISCSFAAPFFLGHTKVANKKYILMDGGTGSENFPIAEGILEAYKRFGYDECMHVIAYGTGITIPNIDREWKKWSKKRWLGDVVDYLNLSNGGFARASSAIKNVMYGFQWEKSSKKNTFQYYDVVIPKAINVDAVSEMDTLPLKGIRLWTMDEMLTLFKIK